MKRKMHDHTKGKSHIRKTKEMMQSPAYRNLKPIARALMDELLLIYQGSNNGQIFLEVREAARRINCHKDSASRAFHELAEHGFIKLTRGDMWQSRKSREWRITFVYHQGREPTNDWMRWEPEKPVFTTPRRRGKNKTRSQNQGQTVLNGGTNTTNHPKDHVLEDDESISYCKNTTKLCPEIRETYSLPRHSPMGLSQLQASNKLKMIDGRGLFYPIDGRYC